MARDGGPSMQPECLLAVPMEHTHAGKAEEVQRRQESGKARNSVFMGMAGVQEYFASTE